MASNYDNSALFYDQLGHLVFAGQLFKAQQHLLSLVKADSRILIIGGGTGRILDALAKIYPSGLQITYVELSAKMMAQSVKRNTGDNHVTFINKGIEAVKAVPEFDVLITSFFFDSLDERGVPPVFSHIDTMLKTNGLWLNTDFELKGQWWQKLLLNTMYLFFKAIGCVDTNKLMNVHPLFQKGGYQLMAEKTFFGTFIFTRAYQKYPGN